MLITLSNNLMCIYINYTILCVKGFNDTSIRVYDKVKQYIMLYLLTRV